MTQAEPGAVIERRGNPIGMVAFVLALVAAAIFVAGFVYGVVFTLAEDQIPSNPVGGAVFGGVVTAVLTMGAALPLTIVAAVLSIVGLALPVRLKGRAGIALAISGPLAVLGAVALPFTMAFGPAYF